MEKSKNKNKFNENIEATITANIYKFLETKTKTQLVMLSKKQIAAEIGISVVSLDKYFTKLNE
ncbi:MAG: hypothetical protein QG565_1438 [Campylobacterota bacterium]|jgi:hypothetical protein|nr:hypothetical protein [Aliarcobacter sp.]MDQ1245097.1 hypothetical protein [Campylobacterota bacterium]